MDDRSHANECRAGMGAHAPPGFATERNNADIEALPG
jgi:hypothetical protein